MNFESFGATHLTYIYVMIFLWFLIPFSSRRFLSYNQQKVVALFLVTAVLGIEIVDDTYRMWDSSVGWDIKTDLPLHMCGFSVFATSWALLKRDQLVFDLSYFWGLGGALQAILTPDTTGFHSHFYLFTFMASHGLIILNVLYLIFVYRMILSRGALLRTVIITNILLVGIAIINFVLDANYFYLFRPPNVNNPLIMVKSQPLYFINMELVAVIVLYIISIPMLINRKNIEK